MSNHNYIQISNEIKQALAVNQPIVALESTIISHGMPWPRNVETALKVEQVVRDHGAIPATIAIMDGFCKVGLNEDEIARLGQSHDVSKVSLRDMAYVLANQMMGATTVAATMRIAAMAGIRIFATGGIGGVHRGAAQSMDISADLKEMAHTDVAVVSAGVKSILDIGLTLEYLETMGVPVVTYGQDAFPSFYSSRSNFKTPLRLNHVNDLAKMLQVKWSLGLEGAVLIANPVPENLEVPMPIIEQHILDALSEADHKGIKGKDITPFLLQSIAEKSGGESLETNIELIQNNAKLAAQIAVAYCQ